MTARTCVVTDRLIYKDGHLEVLRIDRPYLFREVS